MEIKKSEDIIESNKDYIKEINVKKITVIQLIN